MMMSSATDNSSLNQNDGTNLHETLTTNTNQEQSNTKSINNVDNEQTINYFALYDAFKDLCLNNANYFETDDSENGQRLHGAYIGLIDHLAAARTFVTEIRTFVHEYDFNENVPGNGYRSFLLVVRSCITHGIKLSSYVMQNRSSILFRKSMYMKEVEACSHLLASLCTCLQHLMTLRQWSDDGSLFPTGVHTAAELFATAETINQYCFYGRCLGIQYCESIQTILKFLSICMAGFSEAYYNDGGKFTKTTSSMWTGGKYYWNPELRARRIVNISQNAEIDFCKGFWSLAENEIMHLLPSVIGSSVKVNRVITIPPEPLQLPNEFDNSIFIDIPVPEAHLGKGSVTARLLSANRFDGMMGEGNNSNSSSTTPTTTTSNESLPIKSSSFIFHCHGGGFVAQSSKSHEIYLREWTCALNIPILSIDYSLAPDAPFPRAVEECFYAYCWAIKNCSLLGTTAEKIILAGDSAGANLNLAIALKCIEMNVRRPNGIFLAYCPVRINFDPSPARLLCLMDPLLPFGFMMRCLKAYACPSKAILLKNKKKVSDANAIRNASKSINHLRRGGETKNVIENSTVASDGESTSFTDVAAPPMTLVQIDKNNSVSSLNGDNNSSMWEHIDFNAAATGGSADEQNMKSPGSDGTSDTFASASLHSQTIGNTEMMTPDESNGISFEEDSQPITIHRPTITDDGSSDATLATQQIVSDNDGAVAIGEIIESAIPKTNELDDLDDDQLTTAAMMQNCCSSGDDSAGDTSVADFVERYILDTTGGKDHPILESIPTTKSEENILLSAGRDAIKMQTFQTRFYRAVGNVTSSVSNTFNSMTQSAPVRECSEFAYVRKRLNSLIPKSPSEEFIFDIPKDPLLSPFWATDEVLRQLPPIKILSVDMDPCLDDCVMFAKRLKSLNNKIDLDILQGLPHGFLNFVKMSKEAQQGNKVCIKRIAELLTDTEQSTINITPTKCE